MVDGGNGYGQVERMVARLRIGHFYAIHQHQYLIESATVDADIRLSAPGSALPEIGASHIRKQLRRRSYRKHEDLRLIEYLYVPVLVAEQGLEPVLFHYHRIYNGGLLCGELLE